MKIIYNFQKLIDLIFKNNSVLYLIIFSILILSFFPACELQSQESFSDADIGPVTFNKDDLYEIKERLADGDPILEEAYNKLMIQANDYLNQPPLSVVNNKPRKLSDNIHDYVSLAIYWWPNPNTENRLPYIGKDGQRNPEIEEYDGVLLARLGYATEVLSLAYFYSGNAKYAEKTAELINVWFMDEDTYMSPHLKYGQMVPGVNNGSGTGTIESRYFIKIINAVGLIYDSDYWSKKQQYRLKLWFNNFLNWLIDSGYAKTSRSNIGTWRDAQAAAYAIFTERKDLSKKILTNSFKNRLKTQIDDLGRQPYELSRAKPESYSFFNLQGLFTLLSLRENLPYKFEDSQEIKLSLLNALEWLEPYARNTKEMNDNFNRCDYIEIYRKASLYFEEKKYKEIVNDLITTGCTEKKSLLLYPDGN